MVVLAGAGRDDGCFHITKETLTSGTTPAKLVPLRNITAGVLSPGISLVEGREGGRGGTKINYRNNVLKQLNPLRVTAPRVLFFVKRQNF